MCACLICSDPHSVASLLVQQLLAHFSDAFLVSSSKTPDQAVLGEVGGAGGKLAQGSSLREFLCEEVTLLLLTSIYLISKKVRTNIKYSARGLILYIYEVTISMVRGCLALINF